MNSDGNLERMKTLDDAWNAQNWDVFRQRHSVDTAVYWPGQPEPTRGRMPTRQNPRRSSSLLENHLENNPYKVMFAWRLDVHDCAMEGSDDRPREGLDGKIHPPTNSFLSSNLPHSCALEGW